jgi:hypothetical protein
MDLVDFGYPMMDFGKFSSASSQAALRSSGGVVGMMDLLQDKYFILYSEFADSISVVFSLSKSTLHHLAFAQWSLKRLLVTNSTANCLILLQTNIETRSITFATNKTSETDASQETLVFTPLFKIQSPQVHHTSRAQWSLFGHCFGPGPNTLNRMQRMQLPLGDSL